VSGQGCTPPLRIHNPPILRREEMLVNLRVEGSALISGKGPHIPVFSDRLRVKAKDLGQYYEIGPASDGNREA
jgi:hypothetical protein